MLGEFELVILTMLALWIDLEFGALSKWNNFSKNAGNGMGLRITVRAVSPAYISVIFGAFPLTLD